VGGSKRPQRSRLFSRRLGRFILIQSICEPGRDERTRLLRNDGWPHWAVRSRRNPVAVLTCTARYSAAAVLAANLTGASSPLRPGAKNAWSTTMSRGRQTGSVRTRFRLYLASLILVIPAATSSTAHAAVNYCMPLMTADPAEGGTVTIAKRLALANWLRRAATFGVEYTRWSISWNHELVCRASGRGTVVCQAAGHPCAVRQVPPDRFIPLRPGILQTAINPESLAQADPIDARPALASSGAGCGPRARGCRDH